MTNNQQQPKKYDAVLGGQAPPPTNNAVLGGIEGVKLRLNSNIEKVRLDAISEAVKYGDAGLNLVIEALTDESYSMRKAAVNCLWELEKTPRIKEALIASHQSLYPPLQHSADVYSLALTPDGKTLLSGSADGTIKFWNLDTGEVINQMGALGYAGDVLSLAISLDTNVLVASCRYDYREPFIAFDMQSDRWIDGMEKHSSRATYIAITPDGNTIVGGCENSTIVIWDFASKKQRRILKGHSDKVSSLAITRNGKVLVSGSADSTIKVWNLKSETLVKTLKGHSDKVSSIAIIPNSNILVSGSADSTIKVWDLKSGTLLKTLEGHLNSVTSIAITPDGKTLVSGSLDRSIKIWDLASGQLKKTITGNLPEIYAVAIAPNGKTIFSGGDGSTLTGGRADNTILIWDLDSGQLVRSLEGHPVEIPAVAITPDGKTFISGSADSNIKVWDLDSGQLLRTLKGHLGSVFCLAVAPDGKTVVSGRRDSHVAIWDLNSGELVRTFKGVPYWGVQCLAISPDGETIFSGGWESTGVFSEGLQVNRFFTIGSVDTLAIAPDGNTLVGTTATVRMIVNGRDAYTLLGNGCVWDLQSERIEGSSSFRTVDFNSRYAVREIKDYYPLEGGSSCLVITPDSKTVVGGSLDETNIKDIIAIWDLQSGKRLRTLEGHSDKVNSVALTADGNTIVSGSADRTVRVWDFHSGDLLCTLEGHSDEVNSVAVTRDGKTIVSSSNDCTVRVWGIK